MTRKLTRRELLQLAAAGTGGMMLGGLAACGGSSGDPDSTPTTDLPRRLDFSRAGEGEGWGAGWRSVGVANLRRANGEGLMEAGSDVFPNDPRPVAFALDARFSDGGIRAVITRAGRTVGTVLRRQSVRSYYAAIYDTDLHRLSLVRRAGFDLVTLASSIVLPTAVPGLQPGTRATLEFEAAGTHPTVLVARLTGADGQAYEVSATDGAAELQQPGDAGVLTRSDTLLPDSNPILPALGNLHLLPYGVQEGQTFLETPAGQLFLDLIRRRSTAGFAAIEVHSPEPGQLTAASLVAATTGTPRPGGAMLQVAADMPAEVLIDVAATPDFADARVLSAGDTDPEFHAAAAAIEGLAPGVHYWRPRLQRGAQETIGLPRRLRVLPPAGDRGRFTLAYGSCGSQFNAIFDHIAARQPDVFIWQGDLNYADTQGPLAQSISGYAGIWRHFLDNPRMAAILENACFAAGRDDHDYGLQDANAANLPPFGLAPWEALMNAQTWQMFAAGLADVWMVDQRRFKSDPALPDSPDKTLLGFEQRAWLFDGLAASTAPFHVICSPATLAPAPGANERDGSWAAGFTAERDLLLEHIAANVEGQTVFLCGDTHFTMLYERDGLFEQRACPLDIPVPNDQNIANPLLELTFGGTPGVSYWSRRSHFSFLTVEGQGANALLTVELVREDGVTVQTRRFERPL